MVSYLTINMHFLHYTYYPGAISQWFTMESGSYILFVKIALFHTCYSR